jgi:uncharacterized LabA/DUF88 family protein
LLRLQPKVAKIVTSSFEMKKEKAYLFIDGTNLYAAQYELFGPQKYLDFVKFIREIEKEIKVDFDKIYFYASYSPKPKKPTKKEKLYLKNEALFYRSVKKTKKNVIFFKGYRSKTSGKEKEVDVKLAVDITDFAHRRMFNHLFLLSGDADFMSALEKIKLLKINTEILCMENKIMFKGVLFYKTTIISFTGRKIFLKKIRKKPKIIKLEKKNLVGEC